MRKLLTAALLLVSMLTFAQAAPMTITDIQGKSYNVTGTEQGLTIEGLEGKVVFLEFFGHKCPPCLASIPKLNKIQEKYKDKLSIIAIEVQGYNNEEVKKFAQEHKINYTAMSEEKASDFVYYIQQRAQWRGSIPFMVALDTKGDVQFVQAGILSESELEQLYTELSK